MKEYTQAQQCQKDVEAGVRHDQVKELPAIYYSYKLRGVIVHQGSLDHGHYYAYAQDEELNGCPEEDKWLEFNDLQITKFDLRQLKQDTFGTKDPMYVLVLYP